MGRATGKGIFGTYISVQSNQSPRCTRLQSPWILSVYRKILCQSEWFHRLVWSFTVRTTPKALFCMARHNCITTHMSHALTKKDSFFIYEHRLDKPAHRLSLNRFFIVCELVTVNSHYENTPIQINRKFHLQKLKNFQKKKNKLIFIIFLLKNIERGYSLKSPRRGGSNEYPHTMFLSRNKKNNVCPCKPQFYYIKVGFKGVKII